jgi:hypothetical protein
MAQSGVRPGRNVLSGPPGLALTMAVSILFRLKTSECWDGAGQG